MAVVFDSSTSNAVAVAASATTGSVSAPIVVNTNAEDLYALVGVEWIGSVDISAATFTAQFGGQAMTLIGQLPWGSNHYTVLLFGLDEPPDGSQSVVASVSGVPTGGVTRKLRMVAATYSGTDGPGAPVLSTPATTSSNTVTVPSGAAADRVVAVHAASTLQYSYSNYNLTKRARSVNVPNPIDYLLGDRGEDLLLGDAPGAASVTSTATQQSSANWGAIGVSLAPAAVNWDVGLSLPTPGLAMGMAVYRGGKAAPDRTWLLDAGFVGVQDTRIGPAGTAVAYAEATNEGWQFFAANGDPIGDPVVPPGPPITFSAPVAVPGVTGTDRAALPRTLTGARMRTASAPVGSPLTVQVQHYADGVGWTTIATLSIAAGSIIEATATFTQAQLVNDLVRLNVTSIGSTTPATGVVVDVFWNPGVA